MKDIWTEFAKNPAGRKRFETNLNKNKESRDWIFDKINSLWGCKSVLEIGCGLGIDLEKIDTNKINEYWGVDKCSAFINELIETKGNEILKFIHLENTFFDSFVDKSFDCVFCRHVLEHVENPFEILDDMIRISKRYIIIGFFRLTDEKTQIGNIQKNEFGSYIQNEFNEKEILDYFENKGLKIKDTFEVNHNKNFLLKI